MRTAGRVLIAAAAAGMLIGAWATPAFAHASLEESAPGAGATVLEAPRSVRLTFTERVQASLGGIRIFDARGQRLDVGAPRNAGEGGREIVADLPALDDGTYVVTWRVTSDDSHPIRGSFTFSVGSSSATPREASSLASRVTENGGSSVVGALMAVARFGAFLGIALLIGGAAFLVFVWPEGRAEGPARWLLWWSWAAVTGASVVGFLLEGPYLAGLGLADAFRPSLWSEVWSTRFGQVWLGRAALLAVTVPLLRMLLPRRGPLAEHPLSRAWGIAAFLAALLLVASPGLAGHPTAGRWVPAALTADIVHVGAVALWLGGLVMLGVALVRRIDEPTLRRVAPRYSRFALIAVVAIVLSGTFQAFRQIDTFASVFDTDYGRLLALKLGAFALLIVVAAVSRDVVNRRWLIPSPAEPLPALTGARGAHASPGPEIADGYPEGYVLTEPVAERRLRRSIVVEIILGAVILALTALLVNAAPPREQARGPFVSVLPAGDIRIDTTLTPARRGTNELHLTAQSRSGGLQDVVEMTAELGQEAKDIAPIDIELLRAGPGHYISAGFAVPFAGDWQLTIKSVVTDVDQVTATATVPIR